jgi:hypothetical protein
MPNYQNLPPPSRLFPGAVGFGLNKPVRADHSGRLSPGSWLHGWLANHFWHRADGRGVRDERRIPGSSTARR